MKKLWKFKAAVASIVCIMISLTGCQKSAEEQLQEQLELGQKYLLEMKYDEAQVAFENVIQIDPKNLEAYRGLTEVYTAQEEYELALNVLDQAETQLPEEIEIEELRNQVREVRAENVMSQWLNVTDWEEIYDTVISERYEDIFQSLNSPAIVVGEDGKGIGIYRQNSRYYIYVGDYENEMRSGQGIMAGRHENEIEAVPFSVEFRYEGEWDMDYPNGYGEAMQISTWDDGDIITVTGGWKDGLQNGSMTVITDSGTYYYNAVDGWPEIITEFDDGLNILNIYGTNEDGTRQYSELPDGCKLGFPPANNNKDEAFHVIL